MRITKRVREEAALICAIAACEPKWFGRSITAVGYDLDAGWPARCLARDAKNYAYDTRKDGQYELACAEAESLLRTGWTP